MFASIPSSPSGRLSTSSTTCTSPISPALPPRQGYLKFFVKDANPLYNFQTVQPRKGREFNEMELDIAWDEFAGCKLFATPKLVVIKFPSLNMAGSYTFIYGWIDGAEPVATKGPQTNTRIKWHVDWWLT